MAKHFSRSISSRLASALFERGWVPWGVQWLWWYADIKVSNRVIQQLPVCFYVTREPDVKQKATNSSILEDGSEISLGFQSLARPFLPSLFSLPSLLLPPSPFHLFCAFQEVFFFFNSWVNTAPSESGDHLKVELLDNNMLKSP